MAIGPLAATMAMTVIIAQAKAGHTHAHQGMLVAVDMPRRPFRTGGQSYTRPGGKAKGSRTAELAAGPRRHSASGVVKQGRGQMAPGLGGLRLGGTKLSARARPRPAPASRYG